MLFLATTAALLIPAAAGHGQELPADWPQRDLEGKWTHYRRVQQEHAEDPDHSKNWVVLLGQRQEFDLLEWIALFEGWQLAGPELIRGDAPQAFRAAFWNLGAFDSHNRDNAMRALHAEGDRVLGWIDKYPVARQSHGLALTLALRQQGHEPEDPGAQLPPHDPMQVLVPMLDTPGELLRFGDRLRAEPKARYVHQVLRALDGVIVVGRNDAMVVAKVARLMGHHLPEIRTAATATLTRLPPASVPWQDLLAMTTDAAEAVQRRNATTALSYSSHPCAFFTLHGIAADADHPGASVALVRLGDIGDAYTATFLRELATAQPEREAVAAQLQRVEEHLRASQVTAAIARKWLDRVVWLRDTADPRAATAAAATTRMLRQQPDRQAVTTALRQALLLTDPFDTGARPGSDELLEAYVEEILR